MEPLTDSIDSNILSEEKGKVYKICDKNETFSLWINIVDEVKFMEIFERYKRENTTPEAKFLEYLYQHDYDVIEMDIVDQVFIAY